MALESWLLRRQRSMIQTARSCRGCPHLTKDDVCTKRGFTFFRYEEMVEAMKTCTEACV